MYLQVGMRLLSMLDIETSFDAKFYEDLDKRMEELLEKQISYGYFADQISEVDNISIGTKAAIMEYGSVARNIPSRPFLIRSARLLDKKLFRDLYVNHILLNKSLESAMKPIKDDCIASVQASIDSQKFAPLQPDTIRKKGNDVILIETSEMYDSVEVRIQENK